MISSHINNYHHRKQLLLTFLNKYLKKQHLTGIKHPITAIRNNLYNSRPLTKNQIKCLISFLEREEQFKGMKRKDILNFFFVLTQPISNTKDTPNDSTLSNFL